MTKKQKTDSSGKPTRRGFLLGAGALATVATATALSARPPAPPVAVPVLPDILRVPDRVSVFEETKPGERKLMRAGSRWQAGGLEISTEVNEGKSGEQVTIFVSAPNNALTRIRLRWHGSFPMDWRYLGDHWERSYGGLEFRGLAGDRLMPWYFLSNDGHNALACGVKT